MCIIEMTRDLPYWKYNPPLRLRGAGGSTIFADGASLPSTVRRYDLLLSYKVAKGLSNFARFSAADHHV